MKVPGMLRKISAIPATEKTINNKMPAISIKLPEVLWMIHNTI